MLAEHSMVTLMRDVPNEGLRRGALGAIVHVYPGGAAYEVEFDRVARDGIKNDDLASGGLPPRGRALDGERDPVDRSRRNEGSAVEGDGGTQEGDALAG